MGLIDIVQMLSNGYSVREISEISGVGVRTLEGAILRGRKKLFATSVAHLVAIFLRKKLIK